MAFAVADRVKETSTTTGTGTLNLAGAEPGYQTFVAGIGTGNVTYYAIVNRATSEFEVGVGTVTDAATDTLSRDTVISSSNSNALVDFGAGTKDVICTLPSEKSYVLDNAGDTTISADLSVTSISGSGAGLTTLNASNVSSGTLPNARLDQQLQDVAGLALTSGKYIQGNGSNFVLSAYTLPTADGSANQVLQTNGSGAVSFATISADITGVTAGSGLTGGGTSGDVTLNVGAGALIDVSADAVDVDLSELTDMTEDMVGTDEFVVLDASSQKRKAAQEINLSIFNNDLPGDIEGVTAGDGLTGGGTSGTVTLNVGAGNLIDVTADAIDVDLSELTTSTSNGDGDFFCVVDSANAQKKLTKGNIDISGFNNDAGYTTNVGDITGVTAGNGLTGGGTSGAVSLAVGAGTGIDVTADAVAVDVSDFMSNGVNNRVLTATGADAMNAESGLTYDGSTLAVTGVVTETSSIDYKENVKPLEFNDAIYSVNAVKYDFKDGSQKDEVGVIAEELYKVLPDLVTTKDGKPEAVKYTKMTMYLLEALKKQNQEIQELKAKLN
tara:strand:+ start:918 stop:2579 length:1662 start_codon:yes stop_codon:yes gene_type:complete